MKPSIIKILLVICFTAVTLSIKAATAAGPPQVITTADSLALVAFYNATGADSWKNHTNWLTNGKTPDTWFGVTVTPGSPGRVTGLSLSANNLSGTIPVELGNLTALTALDLSGNGLTGNAPTELTGLTALTQLLLNNNQFTSLPNLSAAPLTTVALGNNSFTFESLEPYASVATFTYSPQAVIPAGKNSSIFINLGAAFGLNYPVGGSSNQYQWFKNSTAIPGATTDTYSIASAMLTDAGVYELHITNSILPSLTITTATSTVQVHYVPVSTSDSTVLVNLYNNVNGANWKNRSNWLTAPVGVWYGISSTEGTITGISLPSNNLSGSIDPSLGSLNGMSYLDLSGNNLSGSIPTQLGTASNLNTLNLANNKLTGALPPSLTGITYLSTIDISGNQLTDLSDFTALSYLSSFSIQDNYFTFEDIEPNINIPNITYSPQNNIPASGNRTLKIGDALTLTYTVGGTANQYQWQKDGTNINAATSNSYSIPSVALADAGSYQLVITNTTATGLTITTDADVVSVYQPTSVSDSTALVALYNNTNGAGWTTRTNWLTGPVSSWYGITTSAGLVTQINLPSNNLTGSIPPELGSLSSNFSNLDLSSNKLSGAIPAQLGNLSYLNYVNLSSNSLTGSFPVIQYLYSLDLSNNQLTDLPDLSKLQYLNTLFAVQNNYLTFEDIEPNIGRNNFTYSPQRNIPAIGNFTITAGAPLNLSYAVGGSANQYQWTKSGNVIAGAISNTYNVPAASYLDAGSYQLSISSSVVSKLSIVTDPTNVTVFTPMSVADSTVLVNLYNNTNGGSWKNKANWLTSPVNTWYGVTVALGRVTKLNLVSNNLSGTLPSSIGTLDSLRILNLAGNSLTGVLPSMGKATKLTQVLVNDNKITSLPAFTSLPVDSLFVQNNRLTFESLEPQVAIAKFLYAPQDSIDVKRDTLLQINQSVALPSKTGGTANSYQWSENGVAIPGATASTYGLANLQFTDEGKYSYSVTNSIVTGLTLYSRPITLKVSSLKRDSIALTQLYNATGGANWKTKTNWTTQPITSGWYGVTITNNRVTDLALASNNLSGIVPASITDVQNLKTIDWSSNTITAIPDLSSLKSVTAVNVSTNKLDFGSIIPNVGVVGINYSNQADLGVAFDSVVNVGTNHTLVVTTGGKGNVYQWKLNGTAVTKAVDSVYQIVSINRSNMGTYICEVTNPKVPSLTLKTATKRIRASATLAGKIMIDSSMPVANGNVLLFRITATGGYDTTAVKAINKDGTFALSQVVLDDYQLLAKPDKTTYPNNLPTYYDGKLYWEEADTIRVQGAISDLNITVQSIPTPAKGTGTITGVVEEDIPGGRSGKVEGKRVVSGAEVSARREQSTSRQETITYILAATATTDANGQFTLSNLDAGTYLFNVQYPGYPMDATSAINIVIGSDPATKQAVVAANVTGGKIVVTPVKITGIEESAIAIQAYPNPAKEKLLISSENTLEASQLSIHDMTGRVITLPVKSESNGLEVDLRTLNRGLYILTIVSTSGTPIYIAKVSIE